MNTSDTSTDFYVLSYEEMEHNIEVSLLAAAQADALYIAGCMTALAIIDNNIRSL